MKIENVHGDNVVSMFPGDLRDWFAGQALAGEMATWETARPEDYSEKVASRCYAIADAMLAERAKP